MGFFSWITQDTHQSISNKHSELRPFTVYMIDDQGNTWKEEMYEGYGEFGGKDYYQLVAEMNMVEPIYHNRGTGIDLEFNPERVDGKRKHITVIYPTLVEHLKTGNNWRNEKPASCPDQGFFYPADNDNDYDY